VLANEDPESRPIDLLSVGAVRTRPWAEPVALAARDRNWITAGWLFLAGGPETIRQGNARDRWLNARRSELLAAPYSHVVLTLPHELAPLAM
jgi:hypothetical protein